MEFKTEEDISKINNNYKKIKLWDNELIVFSCGYVYRYIKKRWKLCNLNKLSTKGYLDVGLTNKNKKPKLFRLSRIVYLAFNQEWDIFSSYITEIGRASCRERV